MPDAPAPRHIGNRCYTCHRAVSACWCGTVTTVEAPVQVMFLQHPREARNPIGTLQMAHRALPGSRLLVGIGFEEHPEFQQLITDPTRRHALLYPGPDARDASELDVTSGPVRLWVVDGTWWQARKVFQANPALQALPRYKLQPTQPGQYRIRKEPAAHCLSTVEAVATLLETLEGRPGHYAAMLTPFHTMVEHQLAFAEAPSRTPRRRTRPRPRRLLRTLEGLGADEKRMLLVHGESTGWPASMAGTPESELLQWSAIRPATGERFHAFIRPHAGLGPGARDHQGVTDDMMAHALDAETFVRAWRAFARDDDRWCTWGFHGLTLLKAHGLAVQSHADLRTACCAHLRARVGLVEEAHAKLALPSPEPLGPARGGRRLAQMAAVLRVLLERERP